MLQQRLRSNAAASCSKPQLACARGSRCRLNVSARTQAPKVVYIPNFLEPSDFSLVVKASRRLLPQLRQELNCIAVNRQGCYVPDSSDIAAVFNSKHVAQKLKQRLRCQFPLFLSDFPIELRQYPVGAKMPWHLDEQLFASPQWELIYTIDNSSDSRTEWRDHGGETFSCWTEPNSMLAVEAEGWEHRVLPVRQGSRLILKMAFTSTNIKLPAFETNLTREAYSL